MLVIITYDVNTETSQGRSRLRKVAKVCQNYGQRVQNSVFECEIDSSQFLIVKSLLLELIDPVTDSLRFYNLRDNKRNVEHYGAKPSIDVTAPLIL